MAKPKKLSTKTKTIVGNVGDSIPPPSVPGQMAAPMGAGPAGLAFGGIVAPPGQPGAPPGALPIGAPPGLPPAAPQGALPAVAPPGLPPIGGRPLAAPALPIGGRPLAAPALALPKKLPSAPKIGAKLGKVPPLAKTAINPNKARRR